MTSTLERRALTRSSPRAAAAPAQLLWSGGLAAAWALGAGLVAFAVPVLLVWAADRRSGAGAAEAARVAGQLWLLAQGSPLRLPSGMVGLVPLGLAAVPLALLHRAGRHSAVQLKVRSSRPAAQLVLAVALPYAVVATCLTPLIATDDVTPVAARALLGTLLVGVVGAGSGIVREARLAEPVRRFFPERVRAVWSAATVAAAALLAAGALLVVVAVLLQLSRVTALSGSTGPGVVGGTALVLLQVLLLPNAATWGVSWLAGPGFAVGVGTSVGPWGVALGNVPALPLLGALPTEAPPTAIALAALGVPVAAGVVAGARLSSRLGDRCWTQAGADAGALGLLVGAALALLALLSGGPLGAARLAVVGPSWWQVGLAVAGEVALGALLAALTASHWSRRR